MAYGTLNSDIVQSSTTGTPPQFNDGSGSQIGTLCRAWVNFNGTSGASPVIRASFNVSSITDNGTGDYTINFATAMPDANYSASGGSNADGTTFGVVTPLTLTTSSVRVTVRQVGNALVNYSIICVSVFR